MASLQKDPSGNFHLAFQFGGSRFKRSLKTKSQRKAEAEQKAREKAEMGRQIIQTAGISLDPEGPCEYRFSTPKGAVRSIRVTEVQRDRLSQGELGVAQPHAHLEGLVLLERAAALRLREACPEKLVLLHEPSDEEDEFEGLMW